MFRRLLTKPSIEFRTIGLRGPRNAVQGFARGIPPGTSLVKDRSGYRQGRGETAVQRALDTPGPRRYLALEAAYQDQRHTLGPRGYEYDSRNF
jgi:hypothetical protein